MGYRGPNQRLEELDARNTSYRFDLDSGPCWSRIDEPGRHVSPALLADFGIDVARLGEHLATFDWIYGATVCRSFVALEESIVEFAHREHDRLVRSKSLEALVEEEEKHILMFKRYEEMLLSRHDAAMFELAYAPMGERMAKRHRSALLEIPDDTDRHYLLWLNTIFFEEFTVYLDQRLQVDKERIKPLWLSIHRLHRIEEMQHLATDEAYVDALGIDAARRRELSAGFVMGMLQHFEDTVAVAPALSTARAAGLEGIRPGRVSETGFVHTILAGSAFKRTRAAAPYLRELASGSGC